MVRRTILLALAAAILLSSAAQGETAHTIQKIKISSGAQASTTDDVQAKTAQASATISAQGETTSTSQKIKTNSSLQLSTTDAQTPPSAANPDLVRLHVVAADDSAQAQALKRELRDVCLRCAELCIGDAPGADQAYMRLERHVEDFEAACAARARELGYEGEIRAETGIFDFPDRLYGEVRVPAGAYRALRITIGAGAGHNWWCVLYPTLCVVNEEHAASGEPIYRAQVLAWLRAKLGGAA